MNLRKVQICDWIGIKQWQQRGNILRFFGGTYKIGTDCWIMLSNEIRSEEKEVWTVFWGMIKVLDRAAEKYSIVSSLKNPCDYLDEDRNEILSKIERALPKTVLMLGMEFGKMLAGQKLFEQPLFEQTLQAKQPSFFITYHPRDLVEMPSNKRQAYTELLKLKQYLNSFHDLNGSVENLKEQ